MQHIPPPRLFWPLFESRVESVVLGCTMVLGVFFLSSSNALFAQGGGGLTRADMPTARSHGDVSSTIVNHNLTSQDFDTTGTPFVSTFESGGLPPTVLSGGPTGNFLRLVSQSTGGTNSIAFERTAAGAFTKVVADFDFRMIPEESGSRADGFGFMLLDTATFGSSGEGPRICCYDEPNIPHSFAVGFDIFADLASDPNDNHLSLHFDGTTIASFPNVGFDLANGIFNHAHIELNFVPGGANVTVILTPDSLSETPGESVTPISNYFVSGLFPYESRVAFGARTGGLRADHDLDNIVCKVVTGAVFLVTTTEDSGPGSLRQAILDANATNTETVSTITFNLPRSDPGFARHVFTIQPTTPLPAVRRPTFIDGTSQTAFSGGSNPLGPEVVLNGSLVNRGHGLVLRGDRSAVIGLVINGFAQGAGISLQPSPTGTRPPSHHQIRNNYIGTDRTGTTAVPNAKGVVIQGGSSPKAQAQDNHLIENLIAGNWGVGVSLCEAADTRLTDNRIGTDRTGTAPLGNGSHGIALECAGAPRTLITGNTIAFNAGHGIRIAPDYRAAAALTPDGHQGTTILHNAIFANAARGIRLLPPPDGPTGGITLNDPCDGDDGANHLQNFPELILAASDG
jgi:Right handed beta helix region